MGLKGEYLFGVNAGGPEYTDLFGNIYRADTYNVGKKYTTASPIAGTVDDVLYQSETYGNFTYQVPVAPGTYYLELNYAEIYAPVDTNGERLFDVTVEGALVEDNFDVFALAGGAYTAYKEGYFVEVLDGALTLTFSSEIQNPKLSAFSLWSVVSAGTDTTAPTAGISYSGGKTPGESLTVVVSYSDDTALDVGSILQDELVAAGAGSYLVAPVGRVFSPDNKTATATYEVTQTGGWTNDAIELTVAAGAVADTAGNSSDPASTTFLYGDPLAGIASVDTYATGAVGSARILVTPGSGVQSSTYGTSSFTIENTGDKRIAAIFFDISNAILTDAVFDPIGLAGDSVARGLTFGSVGTTGAIAPGSTSLAPFYGAGGSAGYEGMLVRFDPSKDGGFQFGEKTLFGVDIDPNSIVGIPQQPTDIGGSDPRLNSWDIGGVSGAELTGTRIDVLFTDGSRATGQLIGDGSQGGAVAFVSEVKSTPTVDLLVNGIGAGSEGTWGASNTVIVSGPEGSTARIVMVQGFAQPFDYVSPNGSLISTADRLSASNDPFLANNALKVQTVEVLLDGTSQDITGLFSFSPPGGTLSFPGDDRIPVAFSAVVLKAPGGDPAGAVTAPIYLQSSLPQDTTVPNASITLGTVTDSLDPMTLTVTYQDDLGLDFTTIQLSDLGITTEGPAVQILSSSLVVGADGLSATATYSVLPQGGWTSAPVTYSIAAGAFEDLASNPNALAAKSYTFTQSSGVVVNSLAEMTQLALQGVSLNNPTSIDVGADGRLYVSQQDGLIVALTIAKATTYDSNGILIVTWSVTDREDIKLIQQMPNHNDQGNYEPGVANRQVTGLVTTADQDGNVVLYVGSSDPRIGGGGTGADKNLDTNSGILSRLTQFDDGSGNLVWQKVDLVRGLPRSEENHSINGMELTTDANGNEILLLTVGGFTNAGAQSNNFAYTPEYYYSASVVGIDLTKLAELEATQGLKTYSPPGSSISHRYLYDLPTLDDPTRPNRADGGDLAGNGSTTADVFGGNDGLNQTIHDSNGYVTVLYSGFRNHYDIVVTPSGAVYTVDNGSNTGWGGVPVNASGQAVVDLNGDGLADNGPALNFFNDGGVANADSLLRIDDDILTPDSEMYYGGHPNLYRAWGPDAGFYLFASANNTQGWAAGTPLGYDTQLGQFYAASSPVDLRGLITNADEISGQDALGNPLVDPQQDLFLGTDGRAEGKTDTSNGALYTFFSSTNGLDVIRSDGALQGALVTVSFNGKIYALPLLADGSVDITRVESRSLTSSPLDLVTQGADDPYPGVIFVAAYGADQIVILSPDESQGVVPDPYDRDGDGIEDTIDPFAVDPHNGLLDSINPGDVLTWTFVNGESFPNDRDTLFDGTGGLYNGGAIGFTGLMTNRGGLPESLYVQDNIIFGGAPGVLQVKSVEPGDATTDSQRNGFQLGMTVGEGTTSFTVTSLIDNYLDEIGSINAQEKLAQGIFLGAGDQNNFVSLALVRQPDGRVGFEVTSQFAYAFVGETAPATTFYAVEGLASAGARDTVTLGLDINVASATVTPIWTYLLGGQTSSGQGTGVVLDGDALAALRGALTLPDNSGGQVPTGLAVGVMSSRSGSGSVAGSPVTAISAGGDESFTAMIDGTEITFVPDTTATNVTLVGSSKIYNASESLNVTNSTLDELYTEERYGASSADWGYSIASGNGTFLVDLFFAEVWSGAFAPGARVFDIKVEGILLRDNFDIYQAAGGANLETIVSTTVQVSDGVLDISFLKGVQNAKVNAVLVRTADSSGVFAADWDNLEIRGYGSPPVDLTPPTVALTVSGGVTQDDPVTVIVTYADNVALNRDTIAPNDLTIATDRTYQVNYSVAYQPDDRHATATYTIIPDGGWEAGDEFIFNVAGSALTDTSLNPNAPSNEASFTYDITPPVATLSVSGGALQTEAVTVIATYTDDVALDGSTVESTDLVIIGAAGATYTILSQAVSIKSPTEATVSYSILQDGGWTTDPVEFLILAGAVKDKSGQGNGFTDAAFQFSPAEDNFVFAVNAGGAAYTDSNGVTYQADTFGAGRSYKTKSAISGTEDDGLYQSETWKAGGFTYEIPVAKGTYTVKMHFAEILGRIDTVAERVFDVYLEDQLILDNLDIFAEVGRNSALTIEASIEVLDGSLTLRTSPEVQNPKINAFSIWSAEDIIA